MKPVNKRQKLFDSSEDTASHSLADAKQDEEKIVEGSEQEKFRKWVAAAFGSQISPVHLPNDTQHKRNESLAPPESEDLSTENTGNGMEVDGDEDGDEGHGEDDEEDDVSELSEGDDLRQDFEDTLGNLHFLFTGNFYHASTLATPPNPCLHISGLGLVGLPLSERDGKAIISNAVLSPFGHAERTIVDKHVRDTWEIEPNRIVFGNPEWEKYVNNVVCLEVCKALGVAFGNSPPKMELYKLLLYETGSHFLPHQDTEKASGMFATVVIVLPSAYTGGQVVVSHASKTKTIDFAPLSLLSTAVLAWYTDVKHEVKAITSGYRLVLTYNLIHIASPGVPQPILPDMDNSVERLKRVLTKWRDGQYVQAPSLPLLAYLLDHKYSGKDLQRGIESLKGADAHLITILRNTAEELGYMVGLANLESMVYGPADDCGGDYNCRSRYDYEGSEDEYEDEFEETPEMMEVVDSTTSITGLVSLNGVSLLPFGTIQLQHNNLIQRDPFEDETPDDSEYEGYMGNYGGDVTHWYHRTVLVLIQEDDLDDVFFSAAGVPYAFKKLADLGAGELTTPTADVKLWVIRIRSRTGLLTREQVLKMLDLSLKWKDVKMFKTFLKSPECMLAVVNMDLLSKAWKIFSFEAVQHSFEQILTRSPSFSEKMTLIYTVKSKASNEDKSVVRSWCRKQADKVLASYATPDVKDIPVILTVIRHSGWSTFFKILLPVFLQRPHYAFLIALIKALQANRQLLLDLLAKAKAVSTSATSTEIAPGVPAAAAGAGVANQEAPDLPQEDAVDKVIEKALEAAAKQWSRAPAPYAYGHVVQAAKVDRIVEIMEQTIISDNLEICRTLIVDILKVQGSPSQRFTQLYDPLIPRLRALLLSKRRDVLAPPFVDFFQVLIGTYLRDILGKKGQSLNVRLRKIGCGCEDCRSLNKFILDPTTSTTIFRLTQKRRTHLERQINTASDLCSSETVKNGTPHGVRVTKLPEVVEASTWGHRQKAAKKFLSLFGTVDDIKKIMRTRYTDVVAAVEGTTPFGETNAPRLGGGSSASTSNAIPSATNTHNVNTHHPAAAGGPPRASHSVPSRSKVASNSKVANRTAVASSSTLPARPAIVPPAQLAGKKRKSRPVELTVDLS